MTITVCILHIEWASMAMASVIGADIEKSSIQIKYIWLYYTSSLQIMSLIQQKSRH